MLDIDALIQEDRAVKKARLAECAAHAFQFKRKVQKGVKRSPERQRKVFYSEATLALIHDKALIRQANKDGQLTKRQQEVLQLTSNGLRAKAVGLKLKISETTVLNTLYKARLQLHADSVIQAVKIAAQRGLIQ